MGNDTLFADFPSVIPEIKKLYETSDEKIVRLELENKALIEELAIERTARHDAEHRAEELNARITELLQTSKRVRRKKSEIEEVTEYCEFKSDGKRKARPADPIRSYDDFAQMQQHFISKGKVRDWALWTIGVALGLSLTCLA